MPYLVPSNLASVGEEFTQDGGVAAALLATTATAPCRSPVAPGGSRTWSRISDSAGAITSPGGRILPSRTLTLRRPP